MTTLSRRTSRASLTFLRQFPNAAQISTGWESPQIYRWEPVVLVVCDSFIHPLADVAKCQLGPHTTVWQFVVILEGATIGSQCNICSHVLIEGDVAIGDRVTVKSGVQLWDGMRVGNDVFIGPNATFTNDKYPQSRNRQFERLETVIEDGASIGAGAVILPGIHIGESAMIGAGAVVTRNVAAGSTVAGNPAKEI